MVTVARSPGAQGVAVSCIAHSGGGMLSSQCRVHAQSVSATIRRRSSSELGSNLIRLREARRLQRLQRLSSPPAPEAPRPCQPPTHAQPADNSAQSRVLLELAWKTVALMHKNKIIQQKIVALQKETSEFVASIMNNPENKQRYMAQVRAYQLAQQAQAQPPKIDNSNLPLKVEPTK